MSKLSQYWHYRTIEKMERNIAVWKAVPLHGSATVSQIRTAVRQDLGYWPATSTIKSDLENLCKAHSIIQVCVGAPEAPHIEYRKG